MRRLLAPVLLALAAALVSSRAEAQSEADLAHARELFMEGARLAEAGNWEGARDRFERSAKLKRAALTLYNLGIAQQETGRLVDALESFQAFLAQPPDPGTQTYVTAVKGVLPKLEARLAHIEVAVRPADLAGLGVRIDGRDVPPKGPWSVNPGTHQITVALPGYGEVKQSTTIGEGGRATLAFALDALPVPGGPAPGVALPAGLALGGLALFAGGEVAFGVGVSKLGSSSSAKTTIIAGNVVAGAGAVMAGIGTAILIRRVSRGSRAAAPSWVSADVRGLALRF